MHELNVSSLNSHFAGFLSRRSGLSGARQDDFNRLVSRLVSALETGHSCLYLDEQEQQLVLQSKMVSCQGTTPLILSAGRLYLHRYYTYETRLAARLRDMAKHSIEESQENGDITGLFPNTGAEMDWQRAAAEMVMRKTLTIISGGPGTGKTSTVVKILALLILSAGQHPLSIALAAPTGKAAMRLSEAVCQSAGLLDIDDATRSAIPNTATTLHRLLGVRRGSPYFLHNHDNPLPHEVVVIDEASMVDLALMSKLVDAIRPGARLILLGDKDQLASVESGAIFGDCVNSLIDNTVQLQKTYRFDTGIKQLAEAVKDGAGERAWDLLMAADSPTVACLFEDIVDYAISRYRRYLDAIMQPKEADLTKLFALFKEFRILCALRFGNFGVETINRQLELRLGLAARFDKTKDWYKGRPVLITENDYELGLYNGDIGICLEREDKKQLSVWFEESGGGYRSIPVGRLPHCQTAFAMTIHKSQGSEFLEVAVVLPKEESQILSRQLIYTAVTRAKKKVCLLAEKDILLLAISRNSERMSGLADLLKCG